VLEDHSKQILLLTFSHDTFSRDAFSHDHNYWIASEDSQQPQMPYHPGISISPDRSLVTEKSKKVLSLQCHRSIVDFSIVDPMPEEIRGMSTDSGKVWLYRFKTSDQALQSFLQGY
jgi:hypothetical protein